MLNLKSEKLTEAGDEIKGDLVNTITERVLGGLRWRLQGRVFAALFLCERKMNGMVISNWVAALYRPRLSKSIMGMS